MTRVEPEILRSQENEHKRNLVPAFRLTLPFSERRLILLIGDAVAICASVLGALYLWARIDGGPFDWPFVRSRWHWFPLLLGAWWFLAWLLDLYDVPRAGERIGIIPRIAGGIGELLALYLIAYFILPRDLLPRWFFLIFAGFVTAGELAWRWTYATVFTLPPFRRRVLIVGAGWAGRTMAETFAEHGNSDYEIVGFIDDDPDKQGTEISGLPVLGGGQDLLALVKTYQVDQIVVAITHFMGGGLFQTLVDCGASGICVVSMPALYERLTRRVPVEHIGREWVIEAMNGLSANELSGLGRPALALKRVMDIVLGLVGLVVFTILLPFVAMAIKLDCPGTVFYQQTRAGQGRKPFKVIKFRTMVPDAEIAGKPQWAKKDDNRITRVGLILRKTRLDELPQVLNILRGEMSIVGPRPERPEFIVQLQEQIPFYRARLCVKPGLTGWAQINYRYGNSVEDSLVKLQYDLYYIRNWSLWLDLYTIFRTIGVVASFRGT